MNVVLGVDAARTYTSALHLLARLRFHDVHVDAVHVEEPIMATYGTGFFPVADASLAEAEDARRDGAQRVLDDACEAVAGEEMPVTRTYLFTNGASRALMHHADETHADLIAVGSTQKPGYAQMFLGSMGRALTIGAHQSILISKSEVKHEGRLVAVFATDHSAYADECAQMLARFAPQGVSKLILLTVVEPANPTHQDDLRIAMEHRREITARSQALVAHLRDLGLPAEYWIEEGAFAKVTDDVMRQSGADLLIMGARGHGFFERILIGSASLQQAIGSPHNILILRNSREFTG